MLNINQFRECVMEENELETNAAENADGKKDKKDKKSKKEKKSKADKKKKSENENEEQETVGGKLVLFFVTILVIVIWLGIIGLWIKCDVGGFGSTVLYPILKDVPYVNKILPSTTDIFADSQKEESPYKTLDDAIDRIKELELELDSANENGNANQERISELEAQVTELSSYKEEQDKFEEIKEKFYEEVVFSDESPDISEYKSFYESIDPANAEILYKQVVQQMAKNDKLADYVSTYSSMKPQQAADIFNTMTDDLDLVADILGAMDTQSRANIIGKMDKETAAKITEMLKP